MNKKKINEKQNTLVVWTAIEPEIQFLFDEYFQAITLELPGVDSIVKIHFECETIMDCLYSLLKDGLSTYLAKHFSEMISTKQKIQNSNSSPIFAEANGFENISTIQNWTFSFDQTS